MAHIFGGASKTDRGNQLESWGDLKNIMYTSRDAGTAQQKQGASGLTSAADYFKALMSGDQAQMSKVLAPQISVIQNQNAQRLNTASQFGNRSGGTNAAMQQGTEAATKSIQELFDMLGPDAAKEFAAISGTQESEGANLLNLSASTASSLASEAGKTREADLAREQQRAEAAMKLLTGVLMG